MTPLASGRHCGYVPEMSGGVVDMPLRCDGAGRTPAQSSPSRRRSGPVSRRGCPRAEGFRQRLDAARPSVVVHVVHTVTTVMTDHIEREKIPTKTPATPDHVPEGVMPT